MEKIKNIVGYVLATISLFICNGSIEYQKSKQNSSNLFGIYVQEDELGRYVGIHRNHNGVEQVVVCDPHNSYPQESPSCEIQEKNLMQIINCKAVIINGNQYNCLNIRTFTDK